MSNTVTIRVSKELTACVEDTAAKTGLSQGKIVRDQLEKARTTAANQRFMRFA
jgi:predicted DNA binding CopG/RHH family protein